MSSAPRGRPRYPPGLARDHVIQVRVTQSERERIAQRAKAAGETLSEHCRRLLATKEGGDA